MSRYFTIVRMPHPFTSLPPAIEQDFRDKGLKGVHTVFNEDGSYTLQKMPGTRVHNGKMLVSFEVQADETEMQALLDTHGLGNFEIVAYRTEDLLPDPDSTDENPLPNRPDYSRKPVTNDLIDWMEDEPVFDQDGNQTGTQRPTELRLNIVVGTGNWITV